MSFTKKINIFLDDAFSKGVIDNDIKEKLKSFANIYDSKSPLSFINLLAFFGALSTITGSILLTSLNWDKILDIHKITAYILVITLLYCLAFILNKKGSAIAQAIYFIIAGLILAGIILINKMFRIEMLNGEEFLIWFILILPMALILKNKWISAMAISSFYSWIIIKFDLLDIYTLLDLSHYQIISIIALLCNIILLPKTFTSLKDLFYILSFISHICLGTTIFIIGVFNISAQEGFSIFEINQITIFLISINFLCLAINFMKKIRSNKNFIPLLYFPESIIFAILLIILLPLQNQKIIFTILYCAIWFWGCGALTYNGILNRNKLMVNFGIWLFFIGFITKFIIINKTILFSGLGFIILGITLIALALIGEKFRKYIINNYFKNDFEKG